MNAQVRLATPVHDNGLGFLRLVFASLVIISHTIEIADGSRAREPLHWIFGTITLGELAVDGFFLISGYLIAASFLATPSLRVYLQKRIARIFPAFAVASLLSVLVFAPLGGASIAAAIAGLPGTIKGIVSLKVPWVDGVFNGLGNVALNRSMWSIPYEFRCYLLVILLGLAGMLKRPALLAILAIGCMALFMVAPFGPWSQEELDLPLGHYWIGRPGETIRLTSIFLVGSLFYLWRDRVVFSAVGASLATAALIAGLMWASTAAAAIAVACGYLVFAFSGWTSGTLISRINGKDDISYGVYLYGWPVGSLILWRLPSVPVWLAVIATLALSAVLGWVSWRYLEKPIMNWVYRRNKRAASATPGVVDAALPDRRDI